MVGVGAGWGDVFRAPRKRVLWHAFWDELCNNCTDCGANTPAEELALLEGRGEPLPLEHSTYRRGEEGVGKIGEERTTTMTTKEVITLRLDLYYD